MKKQRDWTTDKSDAKGVSPQGKISKRKRSNREAAIHGYGISDMGLALRLTPIEKMGARGRPWL